MNPTIKLGAVARINLRPSPAELAANPTAPIFRPDSITPELAAAEPRERKRAAAKGASLRVCAAGDILAANSAPQLRAALIAQVGPETPFAYCERSLCVLRVDAGQYHPRLLLHFLRQQRVRNVALRQLGLEPLPRYAPAALLANIDLPAFPLEQQARMAATLDQLLEVRRLRIQATAVAAADLDALFDRFFPADGPSRHWPTQPLGTALATVEQGLDESEAKASPHGPFALSFRNLGPDGLLCGELGHLKLAIPERDAGRALVRKGDVLLDLYSRGRRRAAVQESEAPMYAAGMVVRLADRRFHPLWLAAYFGSEQGQAGISPPPPQNACMSLETLRAARLPCPPRELQEQFAGRWTAIAADKAAIEQQIRDEAEQFEAVTSAMFDGKATSGMAEEAA